MDRESLEKYRNVCKGSKIVSIPSEDLNQIILMAEGFIALREDVVDKEIEKEKRLKEFPKNKNLIKGKSY
ncbi:unnamed protein product [marine sediment metagenome]|uniref:Uncharacterized protein n=1 Tax=marine sediment metagenome TaxID=412755 RepID=X0T1D6_9ZZZZ